VSAVFPVSKSGHPNWKFQVEVSTFLGAQSVPLARQQWKKGLKSEDHEVKMKIGVVGTVSKRVQYILGQCLPFLVCIACTSTVVTSTLLVVLVRYSVL
jgi:hypothetical protein